MSIGLKPTPPTAKPLPTDTAAKSVTPTVSAPTKKAPVKAPKKHRRAVPWGRVLFGLWCVAWILLTALSSYRITRLVAIPEDIDPGVSLPTVNEKALDDIRSRDNSGLIVPSQNNSPRSNPFL